MSSTHPILTPAAVYVHTLGTGPLKDPHGKKMQAKELGVWHGRGAPPGVAPYYGPRAHDGRTRYVALDGPWHGALSLSEKVGYHNGNGLKRRVAFLVAVAAATGRALLLPRVIVDYNTYFLWPLLDLASAGVAYRETNFLSNPRA